MCIKEALRLYPPVPGIARKLTKPMTFFDGVTVPAGTSAVMSQGQQLEPKSRWISLALLAYQLLFMEQKREN